MSFVLIKPLTAVIALLLEYHSMYHEGDFSITSAYLYIALINNLAVSVSLYCLGLFYLATEDRLRSFEPFSKFMCIKAVIFFSYWQACLFNVLMRMDIMRDVVVVNEVQNIIISIEIVIAAIFQSIAFSY